MAGKEMRIFTSVEQLIGHTPLLRLTRLEKEWGLKAQVLVKLECMNPGGSAKDRAALSMLDAAERKGLIGPGSVIIEPTSGNTGVGLAMIAAARGYKAVIVMPDTMSVERRRLMGAYGAQLVLTDGKKGMRGAIEKAEEMAREIPGAFIPGQFENPMNPAAHYHTTGPEIWEDTAGKVDIFVAGVGTGGTVTGAGRYLKEKNPSIYIAAVEPFDSPVLSGGKPGPHGIQGIGAGFIPGALDTDIYDEVIPVKTEDAYAAARMLGSMEGVLCGISSGAVLYGAACLAKKKENEGKMIVAFLPDTGERYLSTPLFASNNNS